MKKELHPSVAGIRNGSRGGGSDHPSGSSIAWGAVAVLVGMFVWSYWPTLQGLWSTWNRNQDYSAGQVVPLIAAYLVWSDRKALAQIPVRSCWWGLGVLLIAQALLFFGILYAYGSLEHCSVFLSVIGVVLLVLGRRFAWRARWVLLFLALMFPLPGRVHDRIALPLQDFATSSALFGLESLGVLATREGNVLRLGDQTTIAVAEACSGLRMLTAFVVVAATLAFVVRRPVWQKVVLVLSSIPVAILCNTFRLILTALLFEATSGETAEKFFHDFAGITMMPIAVGVSVGLLILMRWLSADVATERAK